MLQPKSYELDDPKVVGAVVQHILSNVNADIPEPENKLHLNRSQADLVANCYLELVTAAREYSTLSPLVPYEDTQHFTDRKPFHVSDEFGAITKKHAEIFSENGFAPDHSENIVKGMVTPFSFGKMLIAQRLKDKTIAHTLDEAFSKGDTIDGSEIPYRGAFCENIHSHFDGMVSTLKTMAESHGIHLGGSPK